MKGWIAMKVDQMRENTQERKECVCERERLISTGDGSTYGT